MRRLIFIAIYLLLGSSVSRGEIELIPSDIIGGDYNPTAIGIDQRREEYLNLKIAKKYLLEGDTLRARHFIEKIGSHNIKLALLRNYYLALVDFVDGNYRSSYELLTPRQYYAHEYFSNVCLLKSISFIAFASASEIKKNSDLSYCLNKTAGYSRSGHLWLKNLIKFKSGNIEALRGEFLEQFKYVLSDVNTIRIWLKTGIYLHKEKVLLNYLPTIPAEFYEYNSIRELIGMVHYRLGNYELAQSFVEDLSSPNSENIRGNLKLKNKEYELAFGHFKLALSKKSNSNNSLERILTLSWILEQWEEGQNALESLSSEQIDPYKKSIMQVAFYLEMDRYDYAEKNLTLIEKHYTNLLPKDVYLLQSYYGLRTGDQRRFLGGSESACRNFDGLSCWWLMKSFDYPELNKTIEREEKTMAGLDIDLDKLKSTPFSAPLEEVQYIHQKDIEELDSIQVKVLNQ